MALRISSREGREAVLRERGVEIVDPGSVEVSEEVDLEAVGAGVKLHAGTRLRGERTSVGPGSELGREGPVTVENCQLGAGVRLKGGYCSEAVFLDGAVVGSCAHIRGGTLMEEGAEVAHAVGLKQSILFPFVVGGSLLNICDILVSGGTDRRNHTEIGSSYIHFNYTPQGDKATASLVGDVVNGVFLDQAPIFLGGQGGMAGPIRVAFGTVVAAGQVLRRDILCGGRLVVQGGMRGGVEKAYCGGYRAVGRVARNCGIYFGNIVALKAWYLWARRPLMVGDRFRAACWGGAIRQLDAVLGERARQLGVVAEKLAGGGEGEASEGARAEQGAFLAAWPGMKAKMEAAREGVPDVGGEERERFLGAWGKGRGDYVARVRGLDEGAKAAGRAWLGAIVGEFSQGV